jgi:hypothetical protein
LQQASELKSVQKKHGVPRASLGSLSESRQVFDPELLKPIIGELAQQAQLLTRGPRLKDLKQLLTLVDGTLLTALLRMAELLIPPPFPHRRTVAQLQPLAGFHQRHHARTHPAEPLQPLPFPLAHQHRLHRASW